MPLYVKRQQFVCASFSAAQLRFPEWAIYFGEDFFALAIRGRNSWARLWLYTAAARARLGKPLVGASAQKDLGLNNWRGRSQGSGSQMALLHGRSLVVMSHCRFGVWLAIVLFFAEEEGKQKGIFSWANCGRCLG